MTDILMEPFEKVIGDADTALVQLDNLANPGDATDIQGYVWRPGQTVAERIELPGSWKNQNECIVEIDLTTWLATADKGVWHFQVKLTFPGSPEKKRTWPTRWPGMKIIVTE